MDISVKSRIDLLYKFRNEIDDFLVSAVIDRSFKSYKHLEITFITIETDLLVMINRVFVNESNITEQFYDINDYEISNFYDILDLCDLYRILLDQIIDSDYNLKKPLRKRWWTNNGLLIIITAGILMANGIMAILSIVMFLIERGIL